jgi:S-methylmethionine-dependent homocysteine/selenocysteine methylase
MQDSRTQHRAWRKTLQGGGVLVIDGATGSELRRRGVSLSPHAWSGPASSTHAHLLREIHLDYIRAGADVITTNTFGTTRFLLDAAGLKGEFEHVNSQAMSAVLQARQIAGTDIAIAGSISCLPPGFDIGAYPDRETELAAYSELASFLADNGADLLVLEMMQETVHAPLAFEAARRTGLPVWLGLSCRLDKAGVLVGYDFPDRPMRETLRALLDFEPDAVTVMHSPPVAIATALAEIKRDWHGVIGTYPEIAGDAAFGLDRWTGLAAEWIEAGARIVGGCCGTSPAHIRALKATIAAREGPGAAP